MGAISTTWSAGQSGRKFNSSSSPVQTADCLAPGMWREGMVWSGNFNFETLMDGDALETWGGKAARAWAPAANGRGIWIDLGMDMFPLTNRMQEGLPLLRCQETRAAKACKDFGAGLSTIQTFGPRHIRDWNRDRWWLVKNLLFLCFAKEGPGSIKKSRMGI